MNDIKKEYLSAADKLDENTVEAIRKISTATGDLRTKMIEEAAARQGWSQAEMVFYLQLAATFELSVIAEAVGSVVGMDKKKVIEWVTTAASDILEEDGNVPETP